MIDRFQSFYYGVRNEDDFISDFLATKPKVKSSDKGACVCGNSLIEVSKPKAKLDEFFKGYEKGVADEIECVETSGEHLDLQKKLAKSKKPKIKQLKGDYPPYVLSDKIKEIIDYINSL